MVIFLLGDTQVPELTASSKITFSDTKPALLIENSVFFSNNMV